MKILKHFILIYAVFRIIFLEQKSIENLKC